MRGRIRAAFGVATDCRIKSGNDELEIGIQPT